MLCEDDGVAGGGRGAAGGMGVVTVNGAGRGIIFFGCSCGLLVGVPREGGLGVESRAGKRSMNPSAVAR
jgi:hypothetical protein